MKVGGKLNSVKISDSARIYGKVRLGRNSYLAPGVIIRSNDDSIKIGNNSMILENSILIGMQQNNILVGNKTVFGHKCIVIGSEIGDLCEIGNGTIFLPGSKIGDMCIFGERTIVPENKIIPDRSVVLGRPARIIRKLNDEDINMIKRMRNNDVTLSPYFENIIDHNKEEVGMGILHSFKGKKPVISNSAYLYDTAEITGDVKIGDNSIIGSGVKIIGDTHGPVIIGNNVQILENCVLHLLPGNRLIINDDVIIGPGCIIHGTIIGKGTIVESNATVCDFSKIGENCLIRAGSLVKQRSEFNDNSIIEGFPAKDVDKNDKILNKPIWAFK